VKLNDVGLRWRFNQERIKGQSQTVYCPLASGARSCRTLLE
jgi:hypothetical protein